jgi:hypothetical protein
MARDGPHSAITGVIEFDVIEDIHQAVADWGNRVALGIACDGLRRALFVWKWFGSLFARGLIEVGWRASLAFYFMRRGTQCRRLCAFMNWVGRRS